MAGIDSNILEGLEGTHAGMLLAAPRPEIDLYAQHADFDREFGTSLDAATSPKAFASALFDAKIAVGAVYAHELIGPLEQDSETEPLLGRFWSAFADWCIDRTLRFVWQMPAISRFLKTVPEPGQPMPGLFILGLGKLGGNDLNYSSDVDLVAFFETSDFDVKIGAGRTDVAVRALKALTQILAGTHGPRIWRVDWRLRPDPSVTGLAMSAEAGLDFFFFHAAPWRRLAMMKARTVAGDSDSGNHFLKELTPFLWRRTLDFRAIEDIGSIKSRIRDEHPDLDEERAEETPVDLLKGFHVKLGSGGIREIEFIANAMQLVWGGKQPDLQITHTLSVLMTLAELGHLNAVKAKELSAAYTALRGLENRIQIINDAHVHSVPGDKEDMDKLLCLYGNPDGNILDETIPRLRAQVNDQFNGFFEVEKEVEPTSDRSTTRDLKNLNERSKSVLASWRDGFVDYGTSPELAPKMAHLCEAMEHLVDGAANPDDAVNALETFLRSLPPGGQYLRLLAENPELVQDILTPLSAGGAMASLLRHSPHVVDTLIQWQGNTASTPSSRAEARQFVWKQRDYESRLEAMRLHVNEMLYLAYLRAWRGEADAPETRQLLTELARDALETTLEMVAEEYGFAKDSLSIAAYGKFGMGEMMPESDLDIVFIAHGENGLELGDVQQAHKFAARLKTALSTEMRGGRIYEIDTRLRPSGASGAPTVRLATFEDHQMNHAKTWEHLALVPAQFGIGPDFAKEAFQTMRKSVLVRPRDANQLQQDAHSMLAQLREHRIKPQKKGIISLKLAPGGLMEAEYLVAFLVLKHAHQHPELADLPYCGLASQLEKINPGLKGLSEALINLQDLHLFERLYGWTEMPVKDLPLEGRPIAPDADTMLSKINQATSCIQHLIEHELIAKSGMSTKKVAAHQELKVIWAD